MEARSACQGEPDLMERIKKAMKACRGHWMETSETGQFRAAVSAAILESEGDERNRIERSAKALSRVNAMLHAMQTGVPVDIETMAAESQDEDLIPLMKIWRETASA
jgi:hypothetical protein